MRQVQWIWAGLCLVLIDSFGLSFESEEAHCRAQNGFLCIDKGFAFGLVAIVGAVLWGVVALILWVTTAATGWARRR
jgi:hypothetical protein